MPAKLNRRSLRRNPLSGVLRRERSRVEAPHLSTRSPGEDQLTGEPLPRAGADEVRVRAAGGPEDRALYECECGSHFMAPVSASVRCPRCGAAQAW